MVFLHVKVKVSLAKPTQKWKIGKRPSKGTKKGDSKGPSKGVSQGKTDQTSSITVISLIRDFYVLVFNIYIICFKLDYVQHQFSYDVDLCFVCIMLF